MSEPVVVILAAGQGTRMRSATPKLLHPLCGLPMLTWPIRAAAAAGAGRVVVVDNPERRLTDVAQAAQPGVAIELTVQEQARGTADAVRAAAAHFGTGDTVVVLAGDVPLIRSETIRDLAAAHEASGAAATMLTAVLEDPAGYGRVVRGPDGSVEKVVETKSPGDASALELEIREVNSGIFAFDGGELATALQEVRAENAQGELYLPDVLPVLRHRERTVLAREIDDPQEVLGINDRVALAEVRLIAQRRIHERLMRSGVTVVAPEATVIDADVAVGEDSTVAPFTCLHGATRVGKGSTVGPHATLIDAVVGDGAKVVHSHLVEAVVGDRASVGPFAYLRPGARLRERAKVGTFVEIKNSDVGAGSKVPHLSYIGDADIGPETNLGAATITANYDGRRKHRTTIGARVKTSVDTTLIAPVSVGDDAYTAAGSVISHDIPAGALGVARAHQRNVEGYAQRREEREAARKAAEAEPPQDQPVAEQRVSTGPVDPQP